MAKGTYPSDPARIPENGKDRMRFELGDTMVEGGSETSALTDEEYGAALQTYPAAWKKAKFFLLGSICPRFAYEVDTRTGPLTLELQERAKLWKQMYDALKKELETESVTVPPLFEDGRGRKPPYFHTGMHMNKRVTNG